MASFTITIPDAVVPAILDAFVDFYGPLDEGQTKAQLAKSEITEFIRATHRRHRAKLAAQEAETAAIIAANAATATVVTT